MEKNEVKKYLYRNKELMAKFSHYDRGSLYYTVQLEDGNYRITIPAFDGDVKGNTLLDGIDGEFVYYISGNLYYERNGEQFSVSILDDGDILSSDLGTTSFDREIKASFLNRWIDKSIDKGEFVKL